MEVHGCKEGDGGKVEGDVYYLSYKHSEPTIFQMALFLFEKGQMGG